MLYFHPKRSLPVFSQFTLYWWSGITGYVILDCIGWKSITNFVLEYVEFELKWWKMLCDLQERVLVHPITKVPWALCNKNNWFLKETVQLMRINHILAVFVDQSFRHYSIQITIWLLHKKNTRFYNLLTH